MTNEKLQQIIADKNERLEQETINEARHIIDQIGTCQLVIAEQQEKMGKLRADLKKLEIQQINPITILGE